MNNKFTFKRFGQFACAESKANKGQLKTLLGLVIGVIVIYIFSCISQYPFYGQYDFEGPFGGSIAAVMVTTMILTSTAFKNYFSKSKSSQTIMTPATKSEKFAYHYLLNVIVFPLAACVAIVIIYLGFSLSFGVKIDLSENLFNVLSTTALSIISTLSIFLFGAIFFRRQQFLLTLLSIGGIIIALATLGILTRDWFVWESLGRMIHNTFKNYTVDQIMYILTLSGQVFAVIVTTVMTWLTWRKFKKHQIA